MTDSTTLAGWLRKTNFRQLTGNDPNPVQARVQIKTARHHAILLLEAGVKEYSQWFPGFLSISHSTATQRNQLVADLVAAETSREGAVTGGTHKNQALPWQRFSRYLESIGISHDIFLDSFTRSQRNKIIGAFAMALCEGRFLGLSHNTLAVGTIRNSISDVCATFRENGQPNPTKDDDLQLSFLLH